MALTRPSFIYNAIDKCVGVFAHVSGLRLTLRATIVTIFCHMTKEVSIFVKCDTICKLFFCKIPQFRISKFCKVVQQHIKSSARRFLWLLLDVYFSSQPLKNFENLLRIDKVIATSLEYCFLGHSVELRRSYHETFFS